MLLAAFDWLASAPSSHLLLNIAVLISVTSVFAWHIQSWQPNTETLSLLAPLLAGKSMGALRSKATHQPSMS